jgi:hypothetical protein
MVFRPPFIPSTVEGMNDFLFDALFIPLKVLHGIGTMEETLFFILEETNI